MGDCLMATLKINGDTSGYVELVSPAVAGSTSIALDKIVVADSSGRVGIGDDAPAEKFTIKGDGARMTISSNDYEVAMLGRRGSTAPNWDRGYLRMKYDGNNTIVLDTGGDSYFNGGDVGIGTATPGYSLHIQRDKDQFIAKIENDGNNPGTSGNAYADASDGLWVDTRWNTATNTPFKVTSNSGTANLMIIKGNGNVGIGEDVPEAPLDFGVTSNNQQVVLLRQNGNSRTGFGISNDYGVRVLAPHDVQSAGSLFGVGKNNGTTYSGDLFTVQYGGNVGIGTTSPDRLLDVSGTGNVYGKFQSTDATGAGIQVKDSAEDFLIQADGAGAGGLAIYDLGRTTYRWRINSSGVTIPERVQPVYYEPQIKYQAVTGGFRGGSASANTWYPITNQNINGYNNSYSDGARGVNFLIKWTSGNVNRGYHHTVSGHIPILSANSYLGYQNGSYGTATSGTSPSAGLNINITHHTGCASGHNIQCRLWGDGTDYGPIYLQIKAEAPPSGSDCSVSFWKV